MNNEFVKTQVTLLQNLAAEKAGEDEATWTLFVELYYPAMVAFAKGIGGNENAEDVVQDVFVKLVKVLRESKYERLPGKSFRAYVKTLIRNQLHDLYRREKARGYGRLTPLTEAITEDVAAEEKELGAQMDLEWAKACQESAVAHVLEKTALSKQNKEIYREYAVRGRPIGEVAREFGVSKNLVSQIKTRVDKMVAAVAAEYGS